MVEIQEARETLATVDGTRMCVLGEVYLRRHGEITEARIFAGSAQWIAEIVKEG